MTAIVLGATGGVGQAIAHELARKGKRLLLVGRTEQKLVDLADALRSGHGADVAVAVADTDSLAQFSERMRVACAGLDHIEALFCPIGASSRQDDGTLSPSETSALVNANFAAIVVAVDIVLPLMRAANLGTIVGFSSIAAARGRSANIVYAGAKRALESYFESLRHKLAGTGVKTAVYRLGYVETQQNIGKKLLFPEALPGDIARHVVAGMGRVEGKVTLPFFWMPITIVLRALPWWMFKRLKF